MKDRLKFVAGVVACAWLAGLAAAQTKPAAEHARFDFAVRQAHGPERSRRGHRPDPSTPLGVPERSRRERSVEGMKASPGFEQLKPLVGEWEAQKASGDSAHARYQLVSGGTALLERLKMGGEPEMVTVYTPDGDRLAVTHYCSSGNQPQMRTAPVAGEAKQFSFSFVRATNLASPNAGHMDHLTVTVQDRDHFTQEWTWKENGKTHTEVLHFTRK